MTTRTVHFFRFAGIALMLLAGCESNQPRRTAEVSDRFQPEDDARPYRRIAMAQEAAGARHDGMLYEYHFDGDALNSLGEQKLNAMLRANDHAFPVVVYLNVTDEKRMEARKQAVTTCLLDAGLKDTQMQFVVGPNPNAASSGSQNLARLSRTESDSPAGSNPTNPAPGVASGTGAPSGDSGAGK